MIDDPWDVFELPLSAARQLDEICCRFEQELQAGKAPQIEAFLDGAAGVERRALLRELLAMELQYRRQRRESVARDLYQTRFPHEQDVVEFVFCEADSAAAGSASAAWRRRATLAEIPSSWLTDASGRTGHSPDPEAPHPAPHLAGRALDLAAAERRYTTRDLLARGGMGEVFLAVDEVLGRRVALKRLRPGCDELRARFLAEARITGQLEHPGVVPLYDVGQDGEAAPFYIMKLVEGSTLRQAIKDYHQGTPPAGTTRQLRGLQLLQVFVNLCQTVAYAHSRGVIHRDLKPDNVMLGAYGETLILDWGLAKHRGMSGVSLQKSSTPPGLGGGTATHDGTVVGSPSYMSPEAAAGKHEEVTERSDVFLLGATLYEILTGVPPRRGSSAVQLLELARTVDPSPPRSVLPNLPRRLEAICLKAMARRPEDRYGSPLALADDVQRFLAEEPVIAYPDGRAARCWRWCKRRRRQLALAGMAAMLLICAALAVFKVQEVRQWRQREQARRDVATFRRLADEVCFYAASTDPITEQAPYFEPRQAIQAANLATAVSAVWGPQLEYLPLSDERPQLRDELYSLLLLVLQTRLGDRADALGDSLQAVFDRLPSLHTPTRSYYQLLSQYRRRCGQEGLAADADRRAAQDTIPVTSLDHFVAGEQLRRAAFRNFVGDTDATEVSWDASQLEAALREYALALELDPDHYWSHFQRGRCFLALGRTAEAVEALSTCVALRPDVPWGYSARGLAAALGQRYSQALQDETRAMALDPGLLVSRLNRGVVYWLMGPARHKAAIADFTAVLAAPAERRLIEAAFYRGQVLLQQGDWQAALTDFDRVVQTRPDFRAAHRLRSRVNLLHGDTQRGLLGLNDFLALGRDARWRPDSARACYDRGRFLRRLVPGAGARAETLAELAERDLRRALEQGYAAASVCEELGATLELLGRPGEALAIYAQSLRQQPNDVSLRLKRGWLLALQVREYEQAQADFAQAMAAQPQNAEATSGLGYVAACRQSIADAEKYAVRALLQGGGDYLTLHNVACIYARLYRNTTSPSPAYQDLAVEALGRGLDLWRQGGMRAPNALQLIQADDELRVLESSAAYQALLRDVRP